MKIPSFRARILTITAVLEASREVSRIPFCAKGLFHIRGNDVRLTPSSFIRTQPLQAFKLGSVIGILAFGLAGITGLLGGEGTQRPSLPCLLPPGSLTRCRRGGNPRGLPTCLHR